MDKFKKIGKFAIPAAVLLLPLMSLAVVLVPPDVTTPGTPITLTELETRIGQIATFIILISITIAVIFIIWGGIKYVVARGDPTATKEATGIIKSGIIGAIVILGIGVILNTLRAVISRAIFS